jgi:hypothetical protein
MYAVKLRFYDSRFYILREFLHFLYVPSCISIIMMFPKHVYIYDKKIALLNCLAYRAVHTVHGQWKLKGL